MLPIQKVKVGRSFIRDIPRDSEDAAITRAVIALGRSLQLEVIADGIETKAQRCFLMDEQCHQGQGYFYSRPIPSAEFERLLQDGVG